MSHRFSSTLASMSSLPVRLSLRLRRRTLSGLFAILATTLLAPAVHADNHALYELRTYHTNEGKLDALHDRFRNHTMGLFEKHGMKNVAYWIPVDQPNTLIYVLAHKDGDAAKASWQAFVADPDWQEVYKASIADGNLVKKIDNVFMNKTDYSPARK